MNKKKALIFFLKDVLKECREKNILILASSSSFFFFLCLIPSTLLLLSFLTWFFEAIIPAKTFSYISYIESIVPIEIMPTFKTLFNHSKEVLISNKNLNTLHYIILALSSIGFFGSIWKSIAILTGEKGSGTLIRTLKSFISIALSFSFILLTVTIPLIFKGAKYILEKDIFVFLKTEESYLKIISDFEILGMNIFSTVLLFVFFIFFFRFLLHGSTNLKSTVIGSGFFTIAMAMTKIIFLSYISIVKTSLIINYGSLYSVMIFIIWMFTIILVFYLAIIFTITLSKHRYKIGIEKSIG